MARSERFQVVRGYDGRPRPTLPSCILKTIDYRRYGPHYVSLPILEAYVRRHFRTTVPANNLTMNIVLADHAEGCAFRKGGDVLSGYLEVFGDWLLGYHLTISLEGWYHYLPLQVKALMVFQVSYGRGCDLRTFSPNSPNPSRHT